MLVVGFSACPSAVAHAEPADPEPGVACAGTPGGTLTRLTDSRTVLQCRDAQWVPLAETYPSGDTWLTYGPALTLHGQARRNPEMKAGTWVGIPHDPNSTCSASASDVVVAGQLAPPRGSTGEPGQPLKLALSTQLFSIELSGRCLWQRQS